MLSSLAVLILMTQPPPANVDSQVRLLAHGRLPLAGDMVAEPRLLAAVKAKNGSGEDDAEIRQRDQDWRASKHYPLRSQVTGSDCASRLRELIKVDSFVVEAFLSDAKGALVCASGETSDYWQGDEDKWLKTFGEGKDVLVEAAAWDASTATYAIQLSRLMKDGARKIGVLTLTIRIPEAALHVKK